jgi:hypothetical protein
VSEWDKEEQTDTESLHELFHCAVVNSDTELRSLENYLNSQHFTENDEKESEKHKLQIQQEESVKTVVVRGNKKVWVPM